MDHAKIGIKLLYKKWKKLPYLKEPLDWVQNKLIVVEEVPIHDFAHQVEPLFRPELERNMVIWSQAPMQHNIQY
jgi:hypothetical protein